jgi:hypothetical protein
MRNLLWFRLFPEQPSDDMPHEHKCIGHQPQIEQPNDCGKHAVADADPKRQPAGRFDDQVGSLNDRNPLSGLVHTARLPRRLNSARGKPTSAVTSEMNQKIVGYQIIQYSDRRR